MACKMSPPKAGLPVQFDMRVAGVEILNFRCIRAASRGRLLYVSPPGLPIHEAIP
ncbi:MAG: hypothetical protein JWL97_723 [Gemmatimonadales bacterium]|nr:hypothetical protein [Gemmatimonadales bacterium]